MKFKTDGAYLGNIILPEGFIRTEMRLLSEKALKIYMTVVMLAHNKENCELQKAAEIAGLSANDAIEGLKELEKASLVSLSSTSVRILSSVKDRESHAPVSFKTYTPEEIAAMDDEDITMLTGCAEKAFGKMLSYSEIGVLTSLYRWVGMPSSVLVVLIEYISSIGKRSMGYLKSAALDWNERGIDTPAKAHAYITYLEEQQTYYQKMREKLGIFGRNFTKKEREFLDAWKETFTPDEIKEAYEKTVDNTGKISFAYMNKVLSSDDSTAPVHTEKKKEPTKKVAPSKFNNFSQKPKNYDDVKAKAREKLKKLTENL